MADREMADGYDGSERSTTEKAKEKLSNAAHRGEDLVEEGVEKARELGDRAAEMARSRTDEQRERVVGGMRTVADAIRRSSRDLPEDRQQVGRLLDGVADRVEGASRYLEQHDVDMLARDVRRVAREHTPVFLTGAFTLGMIGARLLKSSSDQVDRYGGRDLPATGYTGQLPGEVGGYAVDDGYAAGGYDRGELHGGPSPRTAGYDEGYGTDVHIDRGAIGPVDELDQGIDSGADDVGADWDESSEEHGNV